MKNATATFRVPRYLGLSSAKKMKSGRYRLEFGYSSQLKKKLVTDESGANLIRVCLQPKTKKEIQSETGLSSLQVHEALAALKDADIVKQVRAVKDSQQRYDRHLLFYDLQGADAIEAQAKISNARIALIGMGGIGSWVSMGLIGAGFKELKLLDFDHVELSNLTRQILYTEDDLGRPKVQVAAERLRERNSQTQVTPVEIQVTGPKELKKHLRGMDMVVVSADRPAQIHDWLDEVCMELGIPYVNIGYRDGYGIVGPMTVRGETSCYQCHKPQPQECEADVVRDGRALVEEFEARYQAPSFGPLNSIVSSIGVLEVIKKITGIGSCRSMGVELEVDPMTFEIRETSYERDSNCWHCSSLT